MDTTLTFIPMDRLHALSRGVELPNRADGAALLADVSGFTPLTEALAHTLGPRRGAEEITRCLNLVYDALINAVDRYGGSVISLAGDAITCWFDGDMGPRAAACGLAMQDVMTPFAVDGIDIPSGKKVTLALKVAIAVGPAQRFQTGDPAIQTFDVLTGATLRRMATGERQAERGDVVVHEVVVAGLHSVATIKEWRTDPETSERYAVIRAQATDVPATPWPRFDATLDESLVRPWALPPVYAQLRSGHDAFLAELRSTVSLFARFDGIDYDAATAPERLDGWVRCAQAVAAAYEGVVLKIIVGDKGSYFHVVFGAPLAHDDDAVRAVAAALDLRAAASEAGLTLQTGVSQGRVWVGAYGGATRRAYDVMGDEVNVAARLMSAAAPSQILVSARVADAAGRRYDLRPIGEVSLKGKTTTVAVSEALGRRAPTGQGVAALYAHALVGRDAELAGLERALETARDGASQLLRIEGAAGVGKSHLVAELAARATRRGLRVVIGACQSTAQETAYLPWRQAFRTLLDLQDEPDAASDGDDEDVARVIERVEAFVRAADPTWLLRLPLLGDLLGLPIPDNAATAAFEPSLRRNALFDLVGDIVRRLAGTRPLLFVLDDAHWMDEASRGLTVALAHALGDAPVVMAVVHRLQSPDAPLLPELDALSFHRRLALEDLATSALAALVTDRLGAAPTPLALAVIEAQTQGNPFFTEELVEGLRETGRLARLPDGRWDVAEALLVTLRRAGLLERVEEAWRLADGAALTGVDLGVPDSVEGIVLARIDRLPDEAKLTLRVASVIGRAFDLDALAAAHPLRPDAATLTAQLDLLLARDFARMDAPSPRPSYIFKHHVTHEVAYDTLLFDQRRALHRAVCATLEEARPDDVAALSRHAYLGEDWPRALRYGVDAGRRARRLFANHEAIEQFTRALHGVERLPPDDVIAQRRDIHQQLGALFTVTSQYDRALVHLRDALAAAEAAADREGQAHAYRCYANLYELRGEFSVALEWIQQAVQALGDQETADVADALVTAGLVYSRLGDFANAQSQAERSLHIAQRIREQSLQARAHGLLAISMLMRGHSAAAITQFQVALELYHHLADIHGQGLVHNGIANVYYAQGQLSDAIYHYLRAREFFRQTGDVYYETVAINNLGVIARERGHYDDAILNYQEGLRLLEQSGGSPYILSGVHMNLSATYIQRGEIAAALHHVAISEDYVARAQLRDWLPELHRLKAEVALLAKDLSSAQAEGDTSLDLARELSMRGEEGRTLRVLGEIARARGEGERAERYLTQSVTILRELGEEFEEARGQLALARALVTLGQAERAGTALERCIGIFERLDIRLDLDAARALHRTLITSPRLT